MGQEKQGRGAAASVDGINNVFVFFTQPKRRWQCTKSRSGCKYAHITSSSLHEEIPKMHHLSLASLTCVIICQATRMVLIAVSGTALAIRVRQEATLLFHDDAVSSSPSSTTRTSSAVANATKTSATNNRAIDIPAPIQHREEGGIRMLS